MGLRARGFSARSIPVHVGPIVDSEVDDIFPALASDGATLIFTSDRRGGFRQVTDLYLAGAQHT